MQAGRAVSHRCCMLRVSCCWHNSFDCVGKAFYEAVGLLVVGGGGGVGDGMGIQEGGESI